nr:BatB protein [Pseudomonadota bacterium]
MFLFENGAVEFIWPWCALFLLLPVVVRLLPPREHSEQALRVPFFQRIAALPQTGLTAAKHTKSLIAVGLVWSLIVLAAMRPQWVGDPVELPVSGR